MAQRQISNGNGKTYLYRLNVDPSIDNPGFYKFLRGMNMIPHMKGTCHAEDFPLLFKTHPSRRFIKGDDIYNAQQAYLNSFIEFIKRGNPSCQILTEKITWEPLPKGRSDNVPCMEIHREQCAVQQLINFDKIQVWNNLYGGEQSLL